MRRQLLSFTILFLCLKVGPQQIKKDKNAPTGFGKHEAAQGCRQRTVDLLHLTLLFNKWEEGVVIPLKDLFVMDILDRFLTVLCSNVIIKSHAKWLFLNVWK